jgi:dTDP-4-dehydrorhamnose reductase
VRWLVTGADGQLGTALRPLLASDDLLALGRVQLDITDARAVRQVMGEFDPDVVVNAAAYTAVDAAEADADNAYRVNARGPAVLAAALAARDGRLIQLSTDYVFAGDADRPCEVDDAPRPRSAYGRTKLAGEQAVRELLPDRSFVIRTAWVYGAAGANFVKTMARLERERDTVQVVDDQRGSPTWSTDLARAVIELARSDVAAGIYHCTNGGDTTWFGFARAIFTLLGADPDRVLPTTTAAVPRPAPRPACSILSDAAWLKAGLTPMPHWRDALRAAFEVSGDELRAG